MAALFIVALFASGCGATGPRVGRTQTTTGFVERRTTTTTTTHHPAPPPVAEPEPAPEPKPMGDTIVVASSIREACGLSDDDMAAAKFKVSSASLESGARSLLATIGKCVADGKLGDAKLELVGFTDPRGSEEYNERLGLKRAQSAKSELQRNGVKASRLTAESKGESEAKGVDESSWALDRRVEIRLEP